MRVLCVNDLPAGGASGAEVHLSLLLDGLPRAGVTAELFSGTPRRGLGRFADTWDPSAKVALERRIEAFRPDVLHFHNVVRELSTAVLLAAPHVPRVVTAHDGRLLGDADGTGALLRLWQRKVRAPIDGGVVRHRADRVLTVSAELARRLRGAGFANVEHHPLWAARPVSPLLGPALSQDLVFLGRLDPDKGVRVLVDAFEAAVIEHPGARLLLAGDGSLTDELRRRPSVGAGQVVLLGVLGRTEVSRLLATARAVVLPSLPDHRPEGAPLALVEALVHGRPVIVSDDPGSEEVARIRTDRPAGLVTRAGSVKQLALALRSVLSDDRLVDRLSVSAAFWGASHGEGAALERLLRCYEQLVGVAA